MPGGGRQVLQGLEAGRRYTIEQPEKLPPREQLEVKPMFVRSDRLPGVAPSEAEFDDYAEVATRLGFKWVKAGPLVRSSYHAHD